MGSACVSSVCDSSEHELACGSLSQLVKAQVLAWLEHMKAARTESVIN